MHVVVMVARMVPVVTVVKVVPMHVRGATLQGRQQYLAVRPMHGV